MDESHITNVVGGTMDEYTYRKLVTESLARIAAGLEALVKRLDDDINVQMDPAITEALTTGPVEVSLDTDSLTAALAHIERQLIDVVPALNSLGSSVRNIETQLARRTF